MTDAGVPETRERTVTVSAAFRGVVVLPWDVEEERLRLRNLEMNCGPLPTHTDYGTEAPHDD